MTTDDRAVLVDMAHWLFMLLDTERQINQLVAKNQNAPKHLYEQSEDLKQRIVTRIFED